MAVNDEKCKCVRKPGEPYEYETGYIQTVRVLYILVGVVGETFTQQWGPELCAKLLKLHPDGRFKMPEALRVSGELYPRQNFTQAFVGKDNKELELKYAQYEGFFYLPFSEYQRMGQPNKISIKTKQNISVSSVQERVRESALAAKARG